MFHFEISGIVKSELQPLKISFISILLLNFHFEIFGIKFNALFQINQNIYIIIIIKGYNILIMNNFQKY